MDDLGFIILRCVTKKEHNLLFKECYECIRKLYNNKIIIIDDNSDKKILENYSFENTKIINSEYPGAGELLPYYYFFKLKPFKQAVILHDSMFIKDKININKDIFFLWYFDNHKWDHVEEETDFIKKLNIPGLLDKYNSKNWNGCFGGASVIKYNFVEILNNKYNLFILLNFIKTRPDRQCLERIIGLISFFENKVNKDECSLYGNIHKTPSNFRLSFTEYKNIEKTDLKMLKVWTGR